MRRVGTPVTALGLLVALVATAGDLPVHAATTQHDVLDLGASAVLMYRGTPVCSAPQVHGPEVISA
jgi:hypothetical protein